MATHLDLRHDIDRALLRHRRPRRAPGVAAPLLLGLGALVVAVAGLVGSAGPSEGVTAPFLADQLGRPAAHAPAVRHPAAGTRVALRRSGFTVTSGRAAVSLSSADAGAAWSAYAHGVRRPTPFGR